MSTVNLHRCFLILLSVTLIGCSYPRKEQNHRYTIVAEVETPNGIKTGKSTIRVQSVYFENNNWCAQYCPGPRSQINVDAEAIAVDLDGDASLVILLSSRRNGNWIANNTGQIEKSAEDPKFVHLSCDKSNDGSNLFPERDLDGDGCRDFPPYADVPYFVRFNDPEKFSSITEVDPFDLSKSFGKGVKLKELRLEKGGNEQPKIIGKFPWVANLVNAENYYLNINDVSNAPPFPSGIGRQSFKQESN